MIESPAYQLRHRSLVANHLRHIEESRLQRSRSTRHKSHLAIRQERISLVLQQFDRCAINKLLIILILYGRSPSQDHLIILKSLSHLYHRGQIILDFLQATTGKQSYDRLSFVQIILYTKILEGLVIASPKLMDFLDRRIAYVMYRIMMLLLKEIDLERKDGE